MIRAAAGKPRAICRPALISWSVLTIPYPDDPAEFFLVALILVAVARLIFSGDGGGGEARATQQLWGEVEMLRSENETYEQIQQRERRELQEARGEVRSLRAEVATLRSRLDENDP